MVPTICMKKLIGMQRLIHGMLDADGDPVHQKQSEDSFYTVLTKLYLEWVLHHRSELLNQSGQSIL